MSPLQSIYIQGYVDDICLLAVGKFPNTMSGLMHWVLHTVETWCDEVVLSVNPDKTELNVFTGEGNNGFLEAHFIGVTLIRSVSVKYLRVVLDTRLTWREHVDVKVRKAHNLLWACRRAYGATWGPRPKGGPLVLRLYHLAALHSCILSLLAWLLDG